ncbi:ornithine cyclodeaminase [Streptomyces megasporus]|uniref:ornithine cyclodeaminase n=1 Tax=Streptomyces megasporus TaxID=44060 RepID=UPI0004E1B6D4|nr:ornithine cyclodeaminase [Streptomyces megasporus]
MTARTPSSITYLSGADVAELCADLPIVDLVRDTLLAFRRKEAGIAPETALRWTTPTGASARSLVLPAWAGRAYGCKIINASLGNHRYGLPRAGGLIILNDPETAHPVCVMEGARISALRTAGVSLAAVRAVRDPATLTTVAFLGCGRQAETHRELLVDHCPALEEIVLFDLDRSRARSTAIAWRAALPDVAVTVAPDARTAVERARVTFAVTTTTDPYVELDWVPEGGTFVNVSLDDAAESLLLGCDHLFVDDWDLIVDDTHRLLGTLARAGRVGAPGEPAPAAGRAVDADLPTLVSGSYTRPVTDRDRVVVNPFGMGVHDIAVAAAVYAKAADRGLALPR